MDWHGTRESRLGGFVRVTTKNWWWINKTLIRPDVTIEVPDGTPVPAGFIADGVEVPKKINKKAHAGPGRPRTVDTQ